MAIKKKPSKNFAISEKITPISESVGSLSLLIYGKSGTGKTAFSATLPKPILLLDIREKGTDTIASVEGIDRLAIDSRAAQHEGYRLVFFVHDEVATGYQRHLGEIRRRSFVIVGRITRILMQAFACDFAGAVECQVFGVLTDRAGHTQGQIKTGGRAGKSFSQVAFQVQCHKSSLRA